MLKFLLLVCRVKYAAAAACSQEGLTIVFRDGLSGFTFASSATRCSYDNDKTTGTQPNEKNYNND